MSTVETDELGPLNKLFACALRAQRNEEGSKVAQDPLLDVRELPPARRHSLIFESYEKLGSGAGFILVNDHDPKPLYYQFAAEQPGAFTWEYLEEGPEVWRVRIGRTPTQS